MLQLRSVPMVPKVPIVPYVCFRNYFRERLERLEPLQRLELSFRVAFSEINFDHMRIFCHAGRRSFGNFFTRAQNDDAMRDIEQRPDDMFNEDDREAAPLELADEIDRCPGFSGSQPRHELVEQ